MGGLSRMKSGLPTCNYLWSGMLLLAVGMTAAIAADISLGSVVRFNTTCAMCHEAECSGRLSFDLGLRILAEADGGTGPGKRSTTRSPRHA